MFPEVVDARHGSTLMVSDGMSYQNCLPSIEAHRFIATNHFTCLPVVIVSISLSLNLSLSLQRPQSMSLRLKCICSFYLCISCMFILFFQDLPYSFIHSFRFLAQPPDCGKWSCWAIQNADLVHPIWGELQPKTEDLGIIVKPSSRWWLNQPIWKYARQIGSCPQVGVKIKNIWNHYLVCLTSLPGIWLTKTSPIWSCWSKGKQLRSSVGNY